MNHILKSIAAGIAAVTPLVIASNWGTWMMENRIESMAKGGFIFLLTIAGIIGYSLSSAVWKD